MCRCVKGRGILYPAVSIEKSIKKSIEIIEKNKNAICKNGVKMVYPCSDAKFVKKKIVYLSGPMTGLPKNNFPEFKKVEKELSRMGFKVLNPAVSFPNGNYVDCLRRSLAMLLQADIVCKLKGWEKSKGAILELEIAKALNMKICVYIPAGETVENKI